MDDEENVKIVKKVIPGGQWTLRMALRKFFGQDSMLAKLRTFHNVIAAYILYLRDQGYGDDQLEVYNGIFVRYTRLLVRLELALSFRNVGDALAVTDTLAEVIAEFLSQVPTDVLKEEIEQEIKVPESGSPEDAGGVLV